MPSINLARVSPGESMPESPTHVLCSANAKPENSNSSPPEASVREEMREKNAALLQTASSIHPLFLIELIHLPGKGALGAVFLSMRGPWEERRSRAFGSQACLIISINQRLLRNEVLGRPQQLRPGLGEHSPQGRLLHSLGWTPLIWDKTRQPWQPAAGACDTGRGASPCPVHSGRRAPGWGRLWEGPTLHPREAVPPGTLFLSQRRALPREPCVILIGIGSGWDF